LHSWAIERGIYGIEFSPFDRIRADKLIGKQQPRRRLLTPDELRLIWRAAKDSPSPESEYVRLLLLLGVRRNELAEAIWPEFTLATATWIIPAPRMKGGAPHLVALAPVAAEILQGLPRLASSAFLFTHGDGPIRDFARIKARLDDRVIALNGGEPIPRWTFHDARRAFRTGLSMLNVMPHVSELCLAHRQRGVAKIYDLHRYEPEKREAFTQWATWLLSVVEPQSTCASGSRVGAVPVPSTMPRAICVARRPAWGGSSGCGGSLVAAISGRLRLCRLSSGAAPVPVTRSWSR
jgi:integrase